MKPYSIFLVVFLVTTAIERIYSTFFTLPKIKGVIFEKWTVYPLIVLHVLTYVFCGFEYFNSNIIINLYITTLGLILFLLSFFLRKWSVKTLGKYESCHIEIHYSHKVIRQGPYKFSRNPRYIANMLEIVSITLIANTYKVLIFVLLTYIPFTIYRAVKEGNIMAREIGDAYNNYKHQVKF